MAARIAIDWAIEYALLGVERYGEYYEQGLCSRRRIEKTIAQSVAPG